MGLLALPRFLNCPIPIQSVTATKTLSHSHYREKKLSHSRGKNYRENIANTAISGYRGNNYRNIYKVPITAEKHILHYCNPKAVSLSRVRGRFSSMRDCEGVQICSASLFFCSTCFFFPVFFCPFFIFYWYLLLCWWLTTTRHSNTPQTTTTRPRVGRQSWKEAPMLEVSTMTWVKEDHRLSPILPRRVVLVLLQPQLVVVVVRMTVPC